MSQLPLALIIIILALLRPALAQDGVPLPVSEVAAGVFVYQAPYTLARPTNGGAIANAGFIVGRDGVAVIDSEGSLSAGRRLLAAVRARTGLPVRYVINTHVHPDHVLGNAAFLDEGAVFVGHRNLPEALAARGERYLAANRDLIGEEAFAGTRIVPPGQLVADRLVLDLGAQAAACWKLGLRRTAIPTSPSMTRRAALGSSATFCLPAMCRRSTGSSPAGSR